MRRRAVFTAVAFIAALALLAGCGGEEEDASTTTAELVSYEMTTAEFIELKVAEQREVLDSLLAQEESECSEELPSTFFGDVVGSAFVAPRRTELTEVVLRLCSEGFGTVAG